MFRHFRDHHGHHCHPSDPGEAFADHLGGGRHRGFGGGHGHGFPFGFGGPGGFGFRSGRKLSSADLQLVLLALLSEQPRHGYDLIKAVEERSRGFYSPSPGVIYPALTFLEEAGETASEAEGTRKLYRLTDAGRARLAAHRAEADALLERLAEMGRGMDRVREAFARDDERDDAGERFDPFRRGGRAAPELKAAVHHLRAAMAHLRGAPLEELLRVAEILRRAAEEIRGDAGEGERGGREDV
jgi:DNA-binding PadR family transcriptional regulator